MIFLKCNTQEGKLITGSVIYYGLVDEKSKWSWYNNDHVEDQLYYYVELYTNSSVFLFSNQNKLCSIASKSTYFYVILLFTAKYC